MNEFVIQVREQCLDQTLLIETISINYQNEQVCQVQNVEETNEKEIRFPYTACGVVFE